MAKTNTKTSTNKDVETKAPKTSAKVAKTNTIAAKAKPKAAISKSTTTQNAKAKSDKATAEKKTKKSEDLVISIDTKIIESNADIVLPVNTQNDVPVPTEIKPMPDVRYSDADLAMFADVINEAKSEALEELRMLKERLEDLTSFDAGEESMIYSMHMAEQGSEAQEKEKTYAQIQRISEHIKKLEDAMERIRNKSYGICRVCGCLIAKERLLAVPVTTLSAAYKIHSKCPDDGIDKIEPVRK